MRARNLKPGFFKNEYLAELGPCTQLLFSGLWCLADREGKLEDRPKRIKAEIFPYYEPTPDIDTIIAQLQEKGFLIRYAVNGLNLIKIINFNKHQTPHLRESASIYPDPEQNHSQGHNEHSARHCQGGALHSACNNHGDCRNSASHCQDRLNPDSLNPDSLNPERYSAPPPTSDGSAETRETAEITPEPSSITIFQSNNFEVSQEYFDNLSADNPGLTPELLLGEIKKADDYCTDNHARFKRRANGQLKNPRLFLRNWISKVVIPQQQCRGSGNGGAARSNRNATKIHSWIEKTNTKEPEWKNQETSNVSLQS